MKSINDQIITPITNNCHHSRLKQSDSVWNHPSPLSFQRAVESRALAGRGKGGLLQRPVVSRTQTKVVLSKHDPKFLGENTGANRGREVNGSIRK